MTDSQPHWQTKVFGILPYPAEPRVLLQPGENGYSLPWFLLQEQGKWADDSLINSEMQQKLGMSLNVLYRAHYAEDAVQRQAESIYVLESSLPALIEGEWVGREKLADLPLEAPAHRPVIDRHLAEAEGGLVPEQRPPWARPGWRASATSWIETQLNQMGYDLAEPVETVRNWSLSYVLRAKTAGATFFFKAGADLPLFINEAAVLAELAARYPAYLPLPLRTDPERRWMLLADFGAQPAYEGVTPDQQETMLYTFGQLQVEAAAHTADLLTMGLLDRRLDRLATQIEPLFNDPQATTGLAEAELEQLHGLVPQLKLRCEQLAACDIPYTLVHGDLHTGNVVFLNGKPLFFDWTDACVSHPFFDVMLNIYQHEDIALQTRLRDRYLSLWTGFAPMPRLQEIWDFAMPLFALHHAVSYQHIVAGIENLARHELSSATPSWLSKVLKYMATSLA